MKGKNQFITNLRGSMENMTAVKAKDGDTIVKGKITQMTNPNTEAQQYTRSRFTVVSQIVSSFALIQQNG